MKVLIVSEKDIAAGKIAGHLSGGSHDKSKMENVNIYDFSKDGDEFTVIGLKGHIINVDFPKKFNQWFRVKPRELVWAEPEKKVDSSAKGIAAAIRKLSKRMDRIILATDYDREGELIGVEALDIALKANPGLDVKRSRFSALTKEEVNRAFNELTEVDHNLASSAEARQVVDLAWGATLTRILSLASGQVGKDFLSVGRVQSPTLALIVDREKEIRAFIPVPYWEIHASVLKGAEGVATSHVKGRFMEEAEARAVHEKLQPCEHASVIDVVTSERTEKPPAPFNTTMFLRASTSTGMSAAKAMSVAEDLYTNGWISYPRTDNTVYPPSLNLKEVVEKIANTASPWKAYAQKVLDKGPLVATKGKKTSTDHPPIHPTEVPKATDLNAQQWRVYELVVRRFLATLSDPAVTESMKVTFDLDGEGFSANGSRILKPGFREIYTYGKREDKILPPLSPGESLNVSGVEILSKETKPPGRMSQGSLIQEMENLGLGTKSTRADILDKLYKRDYVRNNPPEPTETGFAMVDALEKYADVISKPDMTSALEKEMDEIAEGNLEFANVIEDSRNMLTSVVDVLERNRTDIGGALRQAMLVKNTIGECHVDQKSLVIRRSRAGKRFVGCLGYPDCEQTYPLPQFGKIVAEPDPCPKCKAPVIKVIQAKKRPWMTCLNMECKGIEEREEKVREERQAKRAAAAAAGEKLPDVPEGDDQDFSSGDSDSPPPDDAVDPEDHA